MVSKVKTMVGKLIKFSALGAEFSPKMFAHPGLKPCRRPCPEPVSTYVKGSPPSKVQI